MILAKGQPIKGCLWRKQCSLEKVSLYFKFFFFFNCMKLIFFLTIHDSYVSCRQSGSLQEAQSQIFVTLLCSIPKLLFISFNLLVKCTGIHTAFISNQYKNSFDPGGGGLDQLDSQLQYLCGFLCCKMSSVCSCWLSQFVFLYVSCRTNSLRTALEIVLPIENESILLRELDQRLNKKDIQQFNLMNSDLAYRELKVREKAEMQRQHPNQNSS